MKTTSTFAFVVRPTVGNYSSLLEINKLAIRTDPTLHLYKWTARLQSQFRSHRTPPPPHHFLLRLHLLSVLFHVPISYAPLTLTNLSPPNTPSLRSASLPSYPTDQNSQPTDTSPDDGNAPFNNLPQLAPTDIVHIDQLVKAFLEQQALPTPPLPLKNFSPYPSPSKPKRSPPSSRLLYLLQCWIHFPLYTPRQVHPTNP